MLNENMEWWKMLWKLINDNMKTFVIGILILLMTMVFDTNILTPRNEPLSGYAFGSFQNDSEFLVFSRIAIDKFDLDVDTGGFGLVGVISAENILDILQMNTDELHQANIGVRPYNAQFGLQGHVFSFMYNNLNMSLRAMKLVLCLLLATVLTLLSYFIAKKFDNNLLGIIFYITFLLSPWIVAFARNLYWVTFTWFLPGLFGLLLSMNYDKKKIYYPLIFTSILIKSLSGYEYISTIMLFTIAFMIVDFFMITIKEEKIKIAKTIFEVGIVCVSAFFLAILLHAHLRGNGSILNGIIDIFNEDVLRRTLGGNLDDFPEVFHASLNASVFDVLEKYFTFPTPVIRGIEGRNFRLMVFSSFVILIVNFFKGNNDKNRDITMFIVFLLASISWFVLGKSHSYIHTHMNYVLWYFGFIQICIYIILKFIIDQISEYSLSKQMEGK